MSFYYHLINYFSGLLILNEAEAPVLCDPRIHLIKNISTGKRKLSG